LDLAVYAAGLIYGSVYLLSIAMWLVGSGLGSASLLIVLPGWFGYGVPFVITLIKYLYKPDAIILVNPKDLSSIREAVLGWLFISASCIVVNLLLVKYATSHTFWAWMPVAGIFTWPLMNSASTIVLKFSRRVQAGTARLSDFDGTKDGITSDEVCQ
jgi:hypothetical protein